MQLEITGHQLEITPNLKALTTEMMHKVQKHFQNIISAHVVLEIHKNAHIAKAHLLVPDHTIDARAETEDLYKSIDVLREKLTTEINKYKQRRKGHQE
ncbi:MAG TPA: ribosome-associated translation inhibitor RaiA [Coxiellaceae bacterium]|nr:ribosome-associated translation inhibitor RaiA [Coxiellaceae bacterium]